MKYNKSMIMRRAWELKRTTNNAFSICLKKSWAEAKTDSQKEEFDKISLDGMTGTEKQKQYAENLVETARLTAKANGIGGIITGSDGVKRYVSQEDADAVRATYIFIKFAIGTKKTYSDVIDMLKCASIFDLADNLKRLAAKNNETVFAAVDKMINSYK